MKKQTLKEKDSETSWRYRYKVEGTPLWKALLFEGRLPWRYRRLISFKLLKRFFLLNLERILPKDNKLILYEDIGRGELDNLVDYIKNKKPDHKIYSLEELKSFPFFEGIFILYRAKTFIYSNSLYIKFHDFGIPKGKKIIFINHGSPPMKSIGYLCSFGSVAYNEYPASYFYDKILPLISAYIAKSKQDAAIMSYAFHLHPFKIYLLGVPRNENLVTNNFRKIKNYLPRLPNYKKIMLYCPTFRDKGNTKIFPFNDFNLKQLESFLEKNKILLLNRPHPFETNKLNSSSPFIVNFDVKVCPNINEALPNIDILITDYSTIYMDFLLLDRPILFVPYDIKKYQKERSLMVDNYDFWTPGDKVYNFKQFKDSILNLIKGHDKFKKRRKDLNIVFNKYQTKDASKKIFKLIEKLNKNE